MPTPATPPKNAAPDEVRALLAKARPESVTVLDVRQDWEYEEFHLPGARLVPLADLTERLDEIARDKPLVVYCHSGKRSAAAASLLAGTGFPDVTNMLGGIMAWKGASAVGSPETGMGHFTGGESPEEILVLAFAMERELGAFYARLAEAASDPELRQTFLKLAGFEDKHKLVVYHLYKRLHPESADIEDLASRAVATAMEGGRDEQEVLAGLKGFRQSQDALDMAMGIAAQPMDLYTRQARATASEDAREALLELAGEERGHLRALATLMDKLGTKKGE